MLRVLLLAALVPALLSPALLAPALLTAALLGLAVLCELGEQDCKEEVECNKVAWLVYGRGVG